MVRFQETASFAGELLQENENFEDEDLEELEKTVSEAPELPKKLNFNLKKSKSGPQKTLIYKNRILKINKLHKTKQ